jgi:hypothetical protein
VILDSSGEAIERHGAIWMARGTKRESLIAVQDGLSQILHGEVIERCRAI